MKKLSKKDYERLKRWIYRYARPLDFCWWKADRIIKDVKCLKKAGRLECE